MRYKLTHHSQEFACPTCGAPVYVGEGAWQDGEACFCSAYCAGYDPSKQKREHNREYWARIEAAHARLTPPA